MKLRRLQSDLFFVTARLAILCCLPIYISDIGLYRREMARLLDLGLVPYKDFPFEYPPLAFALLLFPSAMMKLFHLGTDEVYRGFLSLLILPFDYALFASFRRRRPVPGAAALYLGLTSLLPLLIFDRLDLLVGFALAWPFLGGPSLSRTSWSLGLGGALKLVPLALFPFDVLLGRERTDRRSLLGAAAAAFLPLALSTLAVFLLSGSLSFVQHHSGRGVQVESLLGNLMIAVQALGFAPKVDIESAFRAQQVIGVPGLIEGAKLLFWAVLLAAYGGLGWAAYRGRTDALRATWLFTLTFITFGYVLSPQFLFWLIPLSLLVAGRLRGGERTAFLLLFYAAVALTGWHFLHYWDYANRHRFNVFALLVRNGLLVALWISSWIWLARARPGVAGEEAPGALAH